MRGRASEALVLQPHIAHRHVGTRRLEAHGQRDKAALALDLVRDEPDVQGVVDWRSSDASACIGWVAVPRVPIAATGSGAVAEIAGGFRCLCVCIECGRQADRIMATRGDTWAKELEQVPIEIRECVRQYLLGMHKRQRVSMKLKQAALESRLRSRSR